MLLYIIWARFKSFYNPFNDTIIKCILYILLFQHNQSVIASPLSFHFCHACALIINSFIFALITLFYLSSVLVYLIQFSFLITIGFLRKALVMYPHVSHHIFLFPFLLWWAYFCFFHDNVIHLPYELLMLIFKMGFEVYLNIKMTEHELCFFYCAKIIWINYSGFL